MTQLAAITYDGLPISSGGTHKLKTRGFLAGLTALQSFVEAISLDVIPSNLLIEIVVGDGIPKDFSAPLLSEFDARYTKIRVRKIGTYTGHQWCIDPISLNQLVERFEHVGAIPQAGHAGPSAVIHATWNLLLFDSQTRQRLPYQSKEDYLGFDVASQHYLGHSFVYSRISEATSAHLFLSLPFDEVTAEAKRLVGEIQANFPARLSAKHWKIWRLKKAKNGYVGRKIAALC